MVKRELIFFDILFFIVDKKHLYNVQGEIPYIIKLSTPVNCNTQIQKK